MNTGSKQVIKYKICPKLNKYNNKGINNPSLINKYPKPIVDYKTMRAKALEMYSVVKKSS